MREDGTTACEPWMLNAGSQDFSRVDSRELFGAIHTTSGNPSTRLQRIAICEQGSALVCDEHEDRYGYRRVTAALRSAVGTPLLHKRVQRLVEEMGLRSLIRAKKRAHRLAGLSDARVANILAGAFSAAVPDQKCVTDIAEVNMAGPRLYLKVCMHPYSGEIVAHRMARRRAFELVSSTLDAALSRSRSTNGLTVPTDQGWHDKMQPCQAMLARQGFPQTLARRIPRCARWLALCEFRAGAAPSRITCE
jgi:transposase InsO family protein